MSEEQKVQEELETQNGTAAETEEAVAAAAEDNALELAQQEIAELKEQMLRVQAEMQNVRRRAETDVEKAHKFGVEKFANEMLAVVDNLERALAACTAEDDATKAIREGVDLTLTGMQAALAKFRVETVDPLNEPFNPDLHQAMTMVESAEAAPNTVLAVMQKGYTLAGRLLRPAMVVVSKGAAKIDEKA